MILSFWSPNPASVPQQDSGQSAPVAGRVRMFSLASFFFGEYLNSHSPDHTMFVLFIGWNLPGEVPCPNTEESIQIKTRKGTMVN